MYPKPFECGGICSSGEDLGIRPDSVWASYVRSLSLVHKGEDKLHCPSSKAAQIASLVPRGLGLTLSFERYYLCPWVLLTWWGCPVWEVPHVRHPEGCVCNHTDRIRIPDLPPNFIFIYLFISSFYKRIQSSSCYLSLLCDLSELYILLSVKWK